MIREVKWNKRSVVLARGTRWGTEGKPTQNPCGIPKERPPACHSVEDTIQTKSSVGDGQRPSSAFS